MSSLFQNYAVIASLNFLEYLYAFTMGSSVVVGGIVVGGIVVGGTVVGGTVVGGIVVGGTVVGGSGTFTVKKVMCH